MRRQQRKNTGSRAKASVYKHDWAMSTLIVLSNRVGLFQTLHEGMYGEFNGLSPLNICLVVHAPVMRGAVQTAHIIPQFLFMNSSLVLCLLWRLCRVLRAIRGVVWRVRRLACRLCRGHCGCLGRMFQCRVWCHYRGRVCWWLVRSNTGHCG